MADGSNLLNFPTRLRVVEQSPAGRQGFAPPQPVPEVDQDGNRVLIRGRLYRTFMCASNATRCAAALQVLVELGCDLPEPPIPLQAA